MRCYSHPKAKTHLIFSASSSLQQNNSKVWQNMDSWCWIPLIFQIVFILLQWSQHSALLLVSSVVNLQQYHFLYSVKVLFVLILWVKVWYLHLLCIVIKLGQSIDRNLQKIKYLDLTTVVWIFLLISIFNQSSH